MSDIALTDPPSFSSEHGPFTQAFTPKEPPHGLTLPQHHVPCLPRAKTEHLHTKPTKAQPYRHLLLPNRSIPTSPENAPKRPHTTATPRSLPAESKVRTPPHKALQGSTLPPPNAAQPLHINLPRKSPKTAQR